MDQKLVELIGYHLQSWLGSRIILAGTQKVPEPLKVHLPHSLLTSQVLTGQVLYYLQVFGPPGAMSSSLLAASSELC